MNEDRTSRRVWDYRQPYSAEDRLERGDTRRGGRDDPFAEPRHAEHGYGAGHFGEGRFGRSYEEPVGDNPYGTYPSTGEVMRGDRGLRRGGRDRTDSRLSPGTPGGRGPWPDESRTPWRDRYEPDDPQTRANLAQAYGATDFGRLDPLSEQQDERGWDNAGRRQRSARWIDEGGRFPESERTGAGGRHAGWPGAESSHRGYGHPHGRDASYESFTSGRQQGRWLEGSASSAVRRVGPKGYQRSDERIHEDLCERLAHDGRLEVQDVEVRVSEGVVTLSGAVRDRRQKYCIEDIADDIFGVREVHNQIRVQREGGQGSQSGQGGQGGQSGQSGQGRVAQPGIGQASGEDENRVSGISSGSDATGSSASSYVGGMEVGAGEVPKGTDPHGGTTTPTKRAT